MPKKKPSAGLSKKKRSAVVRNARAGKDIGKKGKNFKKIEDKAYAEYLKKGHSKADARKIAKKVAGAIMWRGVNR